MTSLHLHDFHDGLKAKFCELNGLEAVDTYGDPLREHAALREAAAVLDLSFRGRLCLTGGDRVRFLHGQVTNDVNRLRAGEGCYAALITAKGRMVSDLNVYRLKDELLLDFEPGLSQTVSSRLDQYIIADDVQVVDVATPYGLLTVQGPKAAAVVAQIELPNDLPVQTMSCVGVPHAAGEIYLVNQPRLGTVGYDMYVPTAAIEEMAQRLAKAVSAQRGRYCGWQAFEMARVEAGIPRFGVDMDDANLPPEAGLEERAISYSKGCYIGQEVIARIRTYGQVAKTLRRLRFADDLPTVPSKGDKLFKDGKEVGYVTSAIQSPSLRANIGLGYIRRGANAVGEVLVVRSGDVESPVRISGVPFRAEVKDP
jgi:folate-binding protein YgfZ